MKKFFLATLFVTTLHFAFAQTSAQLTLVDKFFNKEGGDILQDAAHTGCTWSYAIVNSLGGNTYRIILRYTQLLTSQEFSCEYRLTLDHAGKFLSVRSARNADCHSENSNCFGTCRFVTIVDGLPDEKDPKRYEDYTGKSFNSLSCEEYTNAKLFFAWKDAGYYSRY
jgi:hypothetical protein